jgi:hypothetical protein
MGKYGRVRSVRLTLGQQRKLKELFEFLEIMDGSFQAQMVDLIEIAHARLVKEAPAEPADRPVKRAQLPRSAPTPVAPVKDPVPVKPVIQLDPAYGRYLLDQATMQAETKPPPRPPVRSPPPRPPVIEKPLLKSRPSYLNNLRRDIACPNINDWVSKMDCETCKTQRPRIWSECYTEKRLRPENPIFQISKPAQDGHNHAL